MWLIQTLKLAKVTKPNITTIENLMKSFFRKRQLNYENETITSDLIEIMKGFYQQEKVLSVIPFVLPINPPSHLLQHTKGYNTLKTADDNIHTTSLLMT